jgi:hypothetical protein
MRSIRTCTGQAAIAAGGTLELAFAEGRFHVFGPDEKVMRNA